MKKLNKVFIVSSIKEDVETIETYVKDIKAEIECFDSAQSALNQIEKESPDIILLEFQLDDMTGPEFMVKVSERLLHNPNWQVYLITDKDYTEEDKASFLTLGITHILKKPIDQATLIKAIEEF